MKMLVAPPMQVQHRHQLVEVRHRLSLIGDLCRPRKQRRLNVLLADSVHVDQIG